MKLAELVKYYKYTTIYFALCIVLLFSTGCSKKHEPYVSSSTTIRDNTPECLKPVAKGVDVYKDDSLYIDYSNVSEGYIMLQYLGDSPAVKLQITGPDYMTYTYDISDDRIDTFPISAGDGEYTIGVYEQIDGTQYSVLYSGDYTFTVSNTMGAFLYPNHYVDFDENSPFIAAAKDAVKDAHDDLEAINYVYNYVINNMEYDVEMAENVENGYVPDPDRSFEKKTGICLDYATLMTAMLRSQRIPTRMEVGYAGSAYHAWISTYAENIGWINGIVEFDGTSWSIMDPTVADNSGEEALVSFIGDGGSYLTKYIY
ncbi:MAG: transglutaminase-like domain-containing protein [Lachnospiraceae bacterium]|nr:transglutaminase-like domain-containing protein [Lachnospiraceae bacterium]